MRTVVQSLQAGSQRCDRDCHVWNDVITDEAEILRILAGGAAPDPPADQRCQCGATTWGDHEAEYQRQMLERLPIPSRPN